MSFTKTYIKPSQPTPRLPERSFILPTRTQLQPKNTPKPIHRRQRPEVILLIMQIRRNIMTQKREETANRKCLVAPLKYIEVYRMCVV